MRGRLDLLAEHDLGLAAISEVIAGLSPLPGAVEFLDELRRRTQLLILSDTFEQFGAPLMRQLGMPTLLCHSLVTNGDRIVDYRLRMPDQKRASVAALQSLNYNVIAAGDSFNDTSMLGQANHGILFHAPPNVVQQFPQFPAVEDYAELLQLILARM